MARLHLHVSPGARRNDLEIQPNGDFCAYVTARAADGKANRALVVLLSELLVVPKSRISIARGEARRHKIVEVDGLEDAELRARFETLARELGRPTAGHVHSSTVSLVQVRAASPSAGQSRRYDPAAIGDGRTRETPTYPTED